MVDGTAVQAIANLALAGATAAGKVTEIGGIPFSTAQLHDMRRKDPEPDTLGVSTLSGLVGYVHNNRDEIKLESCTVHVVNESIVDLLSAVFGPLKQRTRFVRATAIIPVVEYNRWKGLEEFNIQLQAMFLPTPQRDEVLRVLSHVSDQSAVAQRDDGVTQKVEVKKGISLVDNQNVPNPVVLEPFRTFIEVAQPSSPFVLRLRKGNSGGVEAALFEADGGAWRIDATRSVAEWLTGNLPEGVTVLA